MWLHAHCSSREYNIASYIERKGCFREDEVMDNKVTERPGYYGFFIVEILNGRSLADAISGFLFVDGVKQPSHNVT
jgi:hypothetical protein